MFAPPAAVFCSLLAAAAAAGARTQSFHLALVDDDAEERTIRTTTAAAAPAVDDSESCCGGSSSSTGSSAEDDRYPREIPLSVIRKLNQVANVTELFAKFMPDVDMVEAQRLVTKTGFQSRTAQNIERKAVLIPKSAGCTVELQTISLKDTDDRSYYYYPSCTKVNRCVGCCAHDLLACQPTKKEELHFQVMVQRYNIEGKFEFSEIKHVKVEQHLKCNCDCRVKEQHCNNLQKYIPNECRCVCNNEEDRDKCSEEHLKLWDPATCTCQCAKIEECTSGYGFDYNTCRCEALRMKTKINNYDFNKNTYSFGGS